MTITDAPAAAPTGPLELRDPTTADVVLLQAVQDYPAVSLLCDAAAPAGTLAGLADQAAWRLASEFGRDAEPLVRRLREVVDDLRPAGGTVAVFVSEHHTSTWSLPVPVVDRAVVDQTFATRDLVRALHRTPRHVVLVLTDREARLFDGVGDTLRPPAGGAFPITAAPRIEDAGASRSRGRDADRVDDGFLRTVDRGLGTYLRLHPAPLVLVGAPRVLARFTKLSRNLGRLAGTVRGSHARTPLPRLAALIRPVLDEYLRSRQGEALALLEQRTGTRQVASGMDAVWLAARAERPEMLAVEQGLFFPARVSDDGDFLNYATDVEHPDVVDDAVDEVIEVVLRRGGWVALVDDGALAHHDRIALTLRQR